MNPAGRILVIGYGNPLRGDDAVGRAVARAVCDAAPAAPLEMIVEHQLTPEMAEPVAAAARVFFIDADVDLPPGEVRITPVQPAPTDPDRPMTHHQSPEHLLAMSRGLYGHCPRAWTVAIGPESFDLSESLSPTAQSAIPRALEMIIAKLA